LESPSLVAVVPRGYLLFSQGDTETRSVVRIGRLVLFLLEKPADPFFPIFQATLLQQLSLHHIRIRLRELFIFL